MNEMSLNVSHNYAHNLGCQIDYGPFENKKIKRDIGPARVEAGHCSSAATRAQLLSAKSAVTKRLLPPRYLQFRYERTMKLIGKLEGLLEAVFARPMEIAAGYQIEWGRELLHDQIQSQRNIFRDWKSPSNKKKELQEVYHALKAEAGRKKGLLMRSYQPHQLAWASQKTVTRVDFSYG